MSNPKLYINGIKKAIYKTPQLVNFLKTVEEANNGVIKIHSGAIYDKRGNGILISGLQDVGKTTLVLNAVKGDYSLLGDDMVKINQNGDIIRIQNSAGIFPHPQNLEHLSLTRFEKFNAWFKLHFAQMPAVSQLIQPNIIISYKRIGVNNDRAPLNRIYFLEKGNPSVEIIDSETGISKIIATSLDLFLPTGFPRRFFYNYCFTNDISPTIVEEAYRRILSSTVKDKKIIILRGLKTSDFHTLFTEYENTHFLR